VSVPAFSRQLLDIDRAATAAQIQLWMRREVVRLRRRGVVVALSGGIDSSVVGALAARALGAEHVLGLLLPEADSSPESLRLGRALATAFNIKTAVEDITSTLTAAGCYRRRDAAIRTVIPEYGDGWRCKIVLPDLRSSGYALYAIVVQSPSGAERRLESPDGVILARLPIRQGSAGIRGAGSDRHAAFGAVSLRGEAVEQVAAVFAQQIGIGGDHVLGHAAFAELLRTLGLDVVDADAERLPPALADHYLSLKARGLL